MNPVLTLNFTNAHVFYTACMELAETYEHMLKDPTWFNCRARCRSRRAVQHGIRSALGARQRH